MALGIEAKKVIVAEVAQVAGKALSAVASEYRGLTVSEMTELRMKARNSGVYLRVVRNTLARRAVEGTEFACMQEAMTGPLILAFSKEEPGAAARVIRDFAKEHDKLVVKVLAISGQLLNAKDLDALASLPSRNEALAMVMSVMTAPITKFVRTLAEPHAKLVRTIAAVAESKK